MASVGEEVRARRRLFEERLDRVVSDNEARRPELRCTCPCCGYPTLPERGSYDICELCDWEDDGQDDPYADEAWGGPNGKYSLTEARENFARHLSMYDSEEIGGNEFAKNSPTQARPKRTTMEVFDAMVGRAEPAAKEAQWQRVSDAESELANEKNRKVREYEARFE